ALDDRVCDDGGPVGDRGEGAAARAHRGQAVQDALGELGGRRGRPPGGCPPARSRRRRCRRYFATMLAWNHSIGAGGSRAARADRLRECTGSVGWMETGTLDRTAPNAVSWPAPGGDYAIRSR